MTVPEGTTIYDAAKQVGVDIPVLCHDERYDPVGVCRMCVVDVGGTRVRRRLRAAVRGRDDGHDRHARRWSAAAPMLTELLIADQPPRPRTPSRPRPATTCCSSWPTATTSRRETTALPQGRGRGTDSSNPVIDVNHDACILCDRCVRACDDIQGNDVIGRTGKGYSTRIAFDLDDPMGESHLRHLRRMRRGLPDRRADQQADPRRPDPAARRARASTASARTAASAAR